MYKIIERTTQRVYSLGYTYEEHHDKEIHSTYNLKDCQSVLLICCLESKSDRISYFIQEENV